MVYVKPYNWKGRWKRMELTVEEVAEVMDCQRALSNEIMKECIADASKISKDTFEIKFATAFFEQRCPKLYTMIQSKLDDKIKEEFDKADKMTKEAGG